MKHQFGVDLSSIQWVQGAVEKAGHHGAPYAPPLLQPVHIEQNESGAPLDDLLGRGDIHALIGSREPESFGRHPDVARLFPDYRALERKLYETTKIFPIMHLIAIRRDLYERHRWIATSFYKAFIESERRALARMRLRARSPICCCGSWLGSRRSTRCSAAMPGRTGSRQIG